MDQYQLGVALAVSRIAELRRRADRRRLASLIPGRTAGQHHHEPGVFDADHCQACARQAGLLDHYRQVQQEEAALRQAHRWARATHRRVSVALWSSGSAILLAAIALLSG
jgi:hypothetical protein